MINEFVTSSVQWRLAKTSQTNNHIFSESRQEDKDVEISHQVTHKLNGSTTWR